MSSWRGVELLCGGVVSTRSEKMKRREGGGPYIIFRHQFLPRISSYGFCLKFLQI